ncbi:MAG: hypothetical protein AAGA48_37445, partial [Myxococcota bacterium]
DLFKSFTFTLLRFAALSSIIVSGLLTVGAVMWISAGARPVREAAREMASAEDTWFATLNQTQPVIHELSIRGAPSGDLETVYFAFYDAKLAHKAENADVLLQVMQDQTVAVRAMGHDTRHIFTMLSPSTQARSNASVAYHKWVEVMNRPNSRIAVMLGMAPRPEPRLERYERAPRAVETLFDPLQ